MNKNTTGGILNIKVEIKPHLEYYPPVELWMAPQMYGAGAKPKA